MRRVRIVGVLAALAAGCASPAPDESNRAARVSQRSMVEVEDLARDLSMRYSEARGGVIHLRAKPDNVIFVHESRRAHVNGQRIEMGMPCMRHGTSYILNSPDADLVMRTLKRYRADRVELEPEPKPRVVLPAQPSGLPAAWRSPVESRRWRSIVIHHMASGTGSARAIHRMHQQRGWDGLGYHFVIGNGTLTRNGEVEVGYRWTQQGIGAHCRAERRGDDNWWNRNSIGICLVGNFETSEPTRRQMDQLVRLVRGLMDEYDIPAAEVRPHGGIKKTACPGRDFPWTEFKQRIW
ncbi:MAG: peptidoglycan recognition protein family protein [Planctomycetota bacterium]